MSLTRRYIVVVDDPSSDYGRHEIRVSGSTDIEAEQLAARKYLARWWFHAPYRSAEPDEDLDFDLEIEALVVAEYAAAWLDPPDWFAMREHWTPERYR